MKAKKILLLSHLPSRDELPDLMLANSLASENVCVWKYPILAKSRDAICLIKPDIIILPEIRIEFTRDMAQLCQSWGVKVVQKRCEMGITAETIITDELERCLFGNVDWAKHVDLDLVWGQSFADMLVAHGVPREKIRVIGGIGFDPYFHPLPKVQRGKQRRILFAGGFGYADNSPLYAAPESKPGEKINIELVKNDRENRAIFQQMMSKVIERFPQYEYGIRPHPGERLPAYTDVTKTTLVPLEALVTPLAVSWTDMIIHPGSTLAYEAHLMNKPTFNFRNTNLDAVVGAISPLSNTVDELIAQLENIEFDKSNANPEIIKDLERYYGIVDGKAHKRAAEAILSLDCAPNVRIPNDWPKDEVRYQTEGVYTDVLEWSCISCGNKFHSQRMRNTVKCPYCGIGCIQRKFMITKDLAGNEQRIPMY